ncbi:MAG: hypothetical protein JW953_07275 [Anaerolineae bacterium]|nr:hypothetical protein [Anaerolineae bacterium]
MARLIRLFALLLTIVIILACGLNRPPHFWPIGDTSPAPTPTPAQFSPGPTSINNGLAELKSYRANLTVDFTGGYNGQPVAGRIESLTEVTQSPPARHLYLKLEGQLPKSNLPVGVSEFYQLNGQVYLKKAGDNIWSHFADENSHPVQFGFPTPEQLIILPRLVSSPPLTETLHGLSVQHYRFSENDLHDPNVIFHQAQGEVWIAGDYVAQYVISASLRVIVPNPQAHIFDQGQLRLYYTLTNINADTAITPPTNIATNNILSNLPQLPDAKPISVFPTLIEYTSAISAISATIFYQDTLATLEWAEKDAAIFNEKARLLFSSEGRLLTIIITPADDGDGIKVTLSISQ